MRRASVLLVVLALSGCWLQPGFGPERQNSNPFESSLTEANVASLQPAWSSPMDFGSQPLVTPEAVYAGSVFPNGSGRSLFVRAVARESGATLWQRELPVETTFGFGGVLSVADGQVLTARLTPTIGTMFEALDPATGATVTTVAEPKPFDPAAVAVTNEVIAYRRGIGPAAELVVRRRSSFEVLWTGPVGAFSVGQDDPVIVAGGHVYLREESPSGPAILTYAVAACGTATCGPTTAMAVPPPPPGFASFSAKLLAVTDDGHILIRRSSAGDRGLDPRTDLVALTSDGTLDWTIHMTQMEGVAAAGDAVFAVGADEAGGGLFVHDGSSTWRSEGAVAGKPIAAGGLVYAGEHVFDADGCGSATCSELTTIDLGPGTGGLYGMSVAAGTLFVSRAGPGGSLTAFTPTG
jgi:hypothetical protein